MAADISIGIRISKELHDKLVEAAARSGWTLSQQVRYQLEHDFGMSKTPYLPAVSEMAQRKGPIRFRKPTHEASRARHRTRQA